MHITTQDEFENLFTKRSLILNRPKNDPHRPPRFFQCVDFSKEGLQTMINERVGENGSLYFYREQVKKALEAWKTYNSRQPCKLPAPVGVWQETIAKNRAHVRVIEHECRLLNKLLDEARLKESQEQKAVHRHPKGNVKMKNGQAFSCDGRELVTDAEGVVKFKDNGELLDDYLRALRQRNRSRAIAKRTEQLALSERLKAARAGAAA